MSKKNETSQKKKPLRVLDTNERKAVAGGPEVEGGEHG